MPRTNGVVSNRLFTRLEPYCLMQMKEQEIRPDNLFQRYLELCTEDTEKYFLDKKRHDIPCVACGDIEGHKAFDKLGFSYRLCRKCGTLYQSPRPEPLVFEKFYRDSRSANYWSEVFLPAVAESRRQKIYSPRAKYLSQFFGSHFSNIDTIIDVGAGNGMFLEEWKKMCASSRCIAVEPGLASANECLRKGFEVISSVVESTPSSHHETADLVVCFELLEHVHDPSKFVTVLASLIRRGGYLFMTTLGIEGFDLQVLWDKSDSIHPPHHINFLSRNGFKILLEGVGFSEIQLTTPGKLDVEIVRKTANKFPDMLLNQRFLRLIVENDLVSERFQRFLSENCLSSHTWVLARKP